MAPGKKRSTMFWVRKSHQPENMVTPETENMESPLLEELPSSSDTVRKYQEPENMVKPKTKKKKSPPKHTVRKSQQRDNMETKITKILETLHYCSALLDIAALVINLVSS